MNKNEQESGEKKKQIPKAYNGFATYAPIN